MENTLVHYIGIEIRSLRQAAGLSQVVLGERCGFYQTYLSRIEGGRANPTINALEVIANAQGITVFDLFELVKRRSLEAETKASLP